MFEKVSVENSIGMVLAHDVTEIIPGVRKGPLFKKGHVVTEEDIPRFLDIGKRHLYIYEMKNGMVHENEAASRLAHTVTKGNEYVHVADAKEGRANIIANIDGLLKIDTERLIQLNSIGDIMVVTAHTNKSVKKGEIIAGVKIVPLVTEDEKLLKAEMICDSKDPLVKVLPYMDCKVGLIITGSEIKRGRIRDSFEPAIVNKLANYSGEVADVVFVDDDKDEIQLAIEDAYDKGMDMVIVTGGMSVDPDDVTPSAIRATGAEIITYGVPVLPGAMLMLGYCQGKPLIGLPSCAMYARVTAFDIILPRLLAGEKLTFRDLAVLGHGGICLNCPTCVFPNCSFGKAI